MSRKTDPAKMDHAIQLYVSGKTLSEAAASAGVSKSPLSRAIRSRGIEARGNRVDLPASEIVDRYRNGSSEISLAREYGVTRPVIRRRLQEAGVTIRGHSEAGKQRAASMSPEERLRQAQASHAATRGVPADHDRLVKQAQARERSPKAPSRGEIAMKALLQERGLDPVSEKAVGKYNIDLMMSPVAVEVLGGTWHASRRTHAERTPYILNQGFAMVFVWDTRWHPISPKAADYVTSVVESARRDPSLIGQYWVIRGDGKLASTGSLNDKEFPLVQPSIRDIY